MDQFLLSEVPEVQERSRIESARHYFYGLLLGFGHPLSSFTSEQLHGRIIDPAESTSPQKSGTFYEATTSKCGQVP